MTNREKLIFTKAKLIGAELVGNVEDINKYSKQIVELEEIVGQENELVEENNNF